jgi:hypothetical protein
MSAVSKPIFLILPHFIRFSPAILMLLNESGVIARSLDGSV